MNTVAPNNWFWSGGQIRPAWRFSISTVLVILTYIAVQFVVQQGYSLAGQTPRLFPILLIANLLVLLALLGLFKLLLLILDSKPLGCVGLALHSRWKFELGLGVACGAVMICAVAAGEQVLGVVHFSPIDERAGSVLSWGLYTFALFVLAGASEELSFRGYPFQRLADSIGPVGATVAFSALFGLMHLGNRSHTMVSTANTMIVGVTFAVAYWRTRSLWLPIGMHFSWNFFQGFVLGFPVSGLELPQSLLRTETSGVNWLSGGAYGPEGGVVATVVIILATGYLAMTKSIYTTQEMRELVSTVPPAAAAAETGPDLTAGSS